MNIADPSAALNAHEGPRAALKAVGLRVTSPRVAALEALSGHGHFSVERLLDDVRKTLPTVSFQTLYGVLEALKSAGLVRKIEVGGHPALFELDHGDNHHHTVCRRCGAVEDTPCATQAPPCIHPPAGFAAEVTEVTFYGLCAECSQVSESTIAP
ncbi:Fur family transcriptional regulator [Brevibacterium sp. HMSC22B09]|uniref:Fur family transcriptional regulator n=1 Tax=Brevibacterium sp. HMSC22B09 TaxID=1581055 RepID=UPI0008A2AC24|nr:Fur family transcriptional regulator [Brevibacterium sp. HMSC22B09]OFT97310.1 transcriptional repressor [Brevibacterium sp. HMSC22B09]